jgi:GNAT superfamily N-acetyltransferase
MPMTRITTTDSAPGVGCLHAEAVRYRGLTEPDVEEVAAVVVRCDAQTTSWAPPDWRLPDGHAERELEVWRQDLDGGDLWAEVAVDDHGQVVGVVAVRPSDGHLSSLFVDPPLQGQGLGVTLLDRAEQHLRRLGHERATLNCLADSPALRFYDRNGWERSGEQGHFEAFNMDTIGFRKLLAG